MFRWHCLLGRALLSGSLDRGVDFSLESHSCPPATSQPTVGSTTVFESAQSSVCVCAGVQNAVLTLSGAPVALVAQGHQLAIVWHAADPDSAGCQHLQFSVYNVVEQQKVTLSSFRGVATPAHTFGGVLPVCPNQCCLHGQRTLHSSCNHSCGAPACNPGPQARPRAGSEVSDVLCR